MLIILFLDSHLITYSSGNLRSQVDYILYRKSFRSAVRNVKVIPSEECVQQHQLVVCDFSVRIPKVKRRKFKPRIRTWKLKDPATASRFCDAFRTNVTRAAAAAENAECGGECVVEAERPSTVRCHCGMWPFQEPPVET